MKLIKVQRNCYKKFEIFASDHFKLFIKRIFKRAQGVSSLLACHKSEVFLTQP